ncbi:MAG TPA: hypothetical protein VHQ87_14740 [Rhizobacter sp.]|nr:hypothetical protein [Rhizobacter sp.]
MIDTALRATPPLRGTAASSSARTPQAPQATRASAPVTAGAVAATVARAPNAASLAVRLPAARDTGTQVGRAQMGSAYLERLDAELLDVKASVARVRLAPSAEATARANRDIDRVQATWAQRHAATQGSLDERLAWSAEQPARRQFRLRGVSAEALEARSPNDTELLSFSIVGGERMHGALMVEPGRERGATVRRLEMALSPLGVSVDRAEGADLVLSVAETHWSTLGERLVVRGGGSRFPAGQFAHPRIEALPAALAPQAWSVIDGEQQQRTAQAVDGALDQVTLARTRISLSLAELGRGLDAHQPAPALAEQVSAFAESFANSFAAGATPHFERLAQLAPAAGGITRERVSALLDQP